MRSEVIHFTTTKDVKEQARKLARQDSRTLSSFIDKIVREKIAQAQKNFG